MATQTHTVYGGPNAGQSFSTPGSAVTPSGTGNGGGQGSGSTPSYTSSPGPTSSTSPKGGDTSTSKTTGTTVNVPSSTPKGNPGSGSGSSGGKSGSSSGSGSKGSEDTSTKKTSGVTVAYPGDNNTTSGKGISLTGMQLPLPWTATSIPDGPNAGTTAYTPKGPLNTPMSGPGSGIQGTKNPWTGQEEYHVGNPGTGVNYTPIDRPVTVTGSVPASNPVTDWTEAIESGDGYKDPTNNPYTGPTATPTGSAPKTPVQEEPKQEPRNREWGSTFRPNPYLIGSGSYFNDDGSVNMNTQSWF